MILFPTIGLMIIPGLWSQCSSLLILTSAAAINNTFNKRKKKKKNTRSYHSPPQSICIVPEMVTVARPILFCQIDKVRGEDQTQEADV